MRQPLRAPGNRGSPPRLNRSWVVESIGLLDPGARMQPRTVNPEPLAHCLETKLYVRDAGKSHKTVLSPRIELFPSGEFRPRIA